MSKNITSFIPHLVVSFVNWFDENFIKTHLLVNYALLNAPVLKPHVKHAKGVSTVLLNITTGSVDKLSFTQTDLSFTAKFNGVPHLIVIPFNAMLGIFSPDDPTLGYQFTENIPLPGSANDGGFALAEHTELRDTPKSPVKDTTKPKPKFGVIEGGKTD
jgi:stringent starvation protein B